MNPCYKCQDRKIRCHSTCDLYLNWKESKQTKNKTNQYITVFNYGRCKKVICITTNEFFDSIEEAKSKYNAPCVAACCNGSREYSGTLPNGTKLQWKYLKDCVNRDNILLT